jgi:UDP-N-acetylglucosamine pyrophosphorylase
LEKAGLIESCQVSKREIKDLLELARRDIKTARELMNLDLDWAFIVAYNAAKFADEFVTQIYDLVKEII